MLKYVVLFTLVFIGSAYAKCDEACVNQHSAETQACRNGCEGPFHRDTDACFSKYGTPIPGQPGKLAVKDQAGLEACLKPSGVGYLVCGDNCTKATFAKCGCPSGK